MGYLSIQHGQPKMGYTVNQLIHADQLQKNQQGSKNRGQHGLAVGVTNSIINV